MTAASGWVPPPYPHDRLGGLRAEAAAVTGGDPVDLSVGNPCDPVPDVVREALVGSLERGSSYPASVGFPEYREAASAWMRRRLGVDVAADQVVACVGTKELVASLPRLLALRSPGRDVVLYPAVAYPTYAMGAQLAGLRPVAVPLDERWLPDLSQVEEADAARALVLWLNEPGNPTGSVADAGWYREAVAWARDRGVVVASDECYVEFTFDAARASSLSAGDEGVLAVHSLSKRSNMAGLRAGFVAGDADLVRYLGEVRKHAGLMVPAPVQMAAAAALADDEHVEAQRGRYEERRKRFLDALGGTGIEHGGGPATFYLWLRDAASEATGWELAARFARGGVVVAPGDFYGEGGGGHVRVALVTPSERLVPALERLRGALLGG